jgi:hypothetical protein
VSARPAFVYVQVHSSHSLVHVYVVIFSSANNARHNATQDSHRTLDVVCRLWECVHYISMLYKNDATRSVSDDVGKQFPHLSTSEKPLVTWMGKFEDFAAKNKHHPHFPASAQFVHDVLTEQFSGRARLSLGLYLLRQFKLNKQFEDSIGLQQLAGTTTAPVIKWLQHLQGTTTLFKNNYSLGLADNCKDRVFASAGTTIPTQLQYFQVDDKWLCVVQQLLFVWSAFFEKCFSLFRGGSEVTDLPELIFTRLPTDIPVFESKTCDYSVSVAATSTTFSAKDRPSKRVRMCVCVC